MAALLIPGVGLVQDDTANLLIPGAGIVLAQTTGTTPLPLEFQGTVATALWFNGTQATALHINGVQIWPAVAYETFIPSGDDSLYVAVSGGGTEEYQVST